MAVMFLTLFTYSVSGEGGHARRAQGDVRRGHGEALETRAAGVDRNCGRSEHQCDRTAMGVRASLVIDRELPRWKYYHKFEYSRKY